MLTMMFHNVPNQCKMKPVEKIP